MKEKWVELENCKAIGCILLLGYFYTAVTNKELASCKERQGGIKRDKEKGRERVIERDKERESGGRERERERERISYILHYNLKYVTC